MRIEIQINNFFYRRKKSFGLEALLLLFCFSCGDNLTEATLDAGAKEPKGTCTVEKTSVIAPLWLAGGPGERSDLGSLKKPDAIFLTPDGVLIVGDEAPDHNELLLYDTHTDDPKVEADFLTPLVDFGAQPGPAGDGPLEFNAISGITQHLDGRIFVVEQGNGRIQILRPSDNPRQPPYLKFDSFFGEFATDRDNPGDGEFVRLQAARTDSSGRLYLSDDAKGNAELARRDIQIFGKNLVYQGRLGDSSYGDLGKKGNLKEPENFVIDEKRNRIYVADEGPQNIVVYNFDDHTFVRRFGTFKGTPNGIDIDQNGFLYVMDEGAGQVILFEPDSFTEIYRFGELSIDDKHKPGTFKSPDTLHISVDQDVLVISDQGHHRIQGFRLSDIQKRACVPTRKNIALTMPTSISTSLPLPIRIEIQGPRGKVQWTPTQALAQITATNANGPVSISPTQIELVNGVGTALLQTEAIGEVTVQVEVGELSTANRVQVFSTLAVRPIAGTLQADELNWSPDDGVIHVTDNLIIQSGQTLHIGAGSMVELAAGVRIKVEGSLRSMGTQDRPILFTSTSLQDGWAQIEITQSGSARFEESFLLGGGSTPRIGHCCGPAIYVNEGELEFHHSVLRDSAKGLYAKKAKVTLERAIFAHLEMGAEFDEGITKIADSHFYEFRGVDDNDGLYFRLGSDVEVSRTVVALLDDDGIDTLNSSPTLNQVYIHDVFDKCISLDGGSASIQKSLLVRCGIGIGIKDHMNIQETRPTISYTTIADNTAHGIAVLDKAEGSVVRPVLDSLIIWNSPQSLSSKYEMADIHLDYSCLEHSPAGLGDGNISVDPAFRDPLYYGYQPSPGSPVLKAGRHGEAIGWPGW